MNKEKEFLKEAIKHLFYFLQVERIHYPKSLYVKEVIKFIDKVLAYLGEK